MFHTVQISIPTMALIKLAIRTLITATVYHLIETPIKRVARKITFSGHWSY